MTSGHRYHLTNAAVFVVGLMFVLFVVGVLFTRITYRLDYNEPKVEALVKLEGQAYQVLYLGNSMMQQAANPEIIWQETGMRGYNLALGGAGFLEMELLLTNYLRHNEKPQLLVYAISVNRGSEGNTMRPSVLAHLPSDLRDRYFEFRARHGLGNPWLQYLANRIPAYRFRSAPERLLKYLAQGKTRIPTWISGHLALSYHYDGHPSHPSHKAGLDSNGLKRFLAFAEREGLPVLLIECPNSESFNASVQNRAETLETLTGIAGETPFVSFNEDVSGYETADWVGLNHLSAAGAERFSKALAARLVAFEQGD